MVFHLLFSDKKSHVDKFKRFIRAFLLGIKEENIVPDHITSYFSYDSEEEIKDITSGHRIKFNLIHKPT